MEVENSMNIEKSDLKGLLLGYLGISFMFLWGVWSIDTNGIVFSNLTGFIISLGGLI